MGLADKLTNSSSEVWILFCETPCTITATTVNICGFQSLPLHKQDCKYETLNGLNHHNHFDILTNGRGEAVNICRFQLHNQDLLVIIPESLSVSSIVGLAFKHYYRVSHKKVSKLRS